MRLPSPATRAEIGPVETRRDHPHEHQQFGNGQQGHDQFEAGGNADAEHVQAHKDQVGGNGRESHRQPWKLHMQIGADGQRNGRRREDELDQGRAARHPAGPRPESATDVGIGAAGMRNRGGQFGKTENKTQIHHGHQQAGDQKAESPGRCPAITPAEVFP